jgi:thermitase
LSGFGENAQNQVDGALSPDGSGDTEKVSSAIQYAVNSGAKIIKMSLGTDGFDCNIQNTIANFVPDNVIIVSSAGNAGLQDQTFPAATSKQSPNTHYAQNPKENAKVKACGIKPNMSAGVNTRTIGVSSVSTLKLDQKSDLTNYGKGLEMLAPGKNIYITVPGGLVGAWSGTSFAAPMVSGTLALAMGQGNLNPSMTPSKLAVQVSNSSDSVDVANPKYAGQSNFGFSRLNIQTF